LPETEDIRELERKVKLLSENYDMLLKAFNNHKHFPDDLVNDHFVILKEAQRP
jgi:hypothetical protein